MKNRRKKLQESIFQHLYEFPMPTMLPSQMQAIIQNKDKIITQARQQGADPKDPQGKPIYSPTDVNRFKDSRWLRDAPQKKSEEMMDKGIRAIPNFPSSMLRVGNNMSQLSMGQGEASRVLQDVPPPVIKAGINNQGQGSLPNSALYGVPGAEVVYNPNRINSPIALMALRNNAAKAAMKAQRASGAATAPPPPVSTPGSNQGSAPPSGSAPSVSPSSPSSTGSSPQSPQTPPSGSSTPSSADTTMPRNVASLPSNPAATMASNLKAAAGNVGPQTPEQKSYEELKNAKTRGGFGVGSSTPLNPEYM